MSEQHAHTPKENRLALKINQICDDEGFDFEVKTFESHTSLTVKMPERTRTHTVIDCWMHSMGAKFSGARVPEETEYESSSMIVNFTLRHD